MGHMIVIGATGDVGQGIVAAVLEAGHNVVGIARDALRLTSLAERLGKPDRLQTLIGTLESDDTAAAMLAGVRALVPRIDTVVVSINGPRKLPGLLALPTPEFARLVAMDLTTHFTAAHAFLPAVADGGSYIGIGGGSADFILAGGAHMSIAQAGLRMMYRGLHHEIRERPVHLNLLTIASVVNAPSTREGADPLWVTDAEIGATVMRMLGEPGAYPEPVWRLTRRGADGTPGFAADPPTKVQGLTS